MERNDASEMIKIGFKLERDEDDYPPADWEWMWAKRVGGSTVRLDNIPFFAKGISSGDVVMAEQTDKGLIFKKLHQPSGHSTVRVVVYRENRDDGELAKVVSDIRRSLEGLGSKTELSHLPNLIAVDVPPNVEYESVSTFLSEKERDGILEYEEAALA
ncbi:MAG: DUF4265 domain-containing protein [Candidatus Angelobacter sp.]